MNKKRIVLIGLLAVLCCCVVFLLIYSKSRSDLHRLNIPQLIHVKLPMGDPVESGEDLYVPSVDCYYAEVDADMLQKLNLSVESCEGLTEIGKVYSDDRSQTSSDVVYAYPDSRYPNLAVLMIDEKPAIWQFNSYNGRVNCEQHFQSIYGNLSADKVSIRVRRTEGGDLEPTLTITDSAALTEFCVAFNASLAKLSDQTSETSQVANFYQCEVEVTLSNGFLLRFSYSPNKLIFYHNSAGFWSNTATFWTADALDAWFATYVK